MSKKKLSKKATYQANRDLHAVGLKQHIDVLRDNVRGDPAAEIALDFLVSTIDKLKPHAEKAYEQKINAAEAKATAEERRFKPVIDLVRKMNNAGSDWAAILDALRENASTKKLVKKFKDSGLRKKVLKYVDLPPLREKR